MIKLGTFTILLNEEKGQYYIPELQGICKTLNGAFSYIKEFIKLKANFLTEKLH